MKISFDFDSTLTKTRIQKLAKKFIEAGHEVWITTSRHREIHPMSDWNNQSLFEVAKQLCISKEKIQFTEGKDKWKFLDGFDLHFDDDQIEIELMEENNCSCTGILIL